MKTCLIVDDQEPIRRLVERVLRGAGFRTVLAADGMEAVAVASTLEKIHVLVTDLIMPNMNGDELSRRLRLDQPDLPVLYLSGYGNTLFSERLGLAKNEAFLDKPCTVKGLLEAVTHLAAEQDRGATSCRTRG